MAGRRATHRRHSLVYVSLVDPISTIWLSWVSTKSVKGPSTSAADLGLSVRLAQKSANPVPGPVISRYCTAR